MEELQSITQITSIFGSLPSNLQLEQVVGQGGSGVVVRAREIITDRHVAIKILFHSMRPDSLSVERFAREARVLANLDHPHIVKIYSSGVSEKGNHYHVMEWLEGTTLAEQLQKTSVLPEPLFFELFIQLTSALRYAHSQSVVHRDIKPSNIMLCQESELYCCGKLVDFGIARKLSNELIAGTAGADLTGSGVLVGTPLYMSPEQCAGQRPKSSSDIYSLACVMYQCLTGKTPFQGDNALEVMYNHLHEQAQTLGLAGKGLKLSSLLHRCLVKSPEQRPDAAALLRQLQDIYAELSGKICAIHVAPEPKRKSRMALVAPAVLGLFCCVGAGTAVVLHSRHAHTTTEVKQRALTPAEALLEKKLEGLGKEIERYQPYFKRAKTDDEANDYATKLARLYYEKGLALDALAGKELAAKMPGRCQRLVNEAGAEYLRILWLCKQFNPENKSGLKFEALKRIAALQEVSLDCHAAINTYSQALELAGTMNGLVESEVLASRAQSFLRLKMFAECDADVSRVLQIWTHCNDPNDLPYVPSPNKVLGPTKKESRVNEKAIQEIRSVGNTGVGYVDSPEQRLHSLIMLMRYSKFLLDRSSEYSLEAAGCMDTVCKTFSVASGETASIVRQAYELCAECAASLHNKAKEHEYRELAARY
jgi:tRNA A-37 threonylcarbamoyl transferase component Bud32